MTQPPPPQSQKKIDGGHIKGAANCANVIEVRMQFQLPNTKGMNLIVHGSYITAPANLQTLATALFGSLSSAWGSNLGLYMATTTAFQNVFVRDMTDHTTPVFTGTGTAVPGTSASPAMPVNAAIVMTENVNVRGRGAKGRVYLGGWATNADAGAGLINDAVRLAINAFGTALASALSAQSLTPCVAYVQRQAYIGLTGTSHPIRPAARPPVTSYICQDLRWDTQRRRIQA